MQQTTELTTAEVERALETVLSRPEFAAPEPPLLYRWVGRLMDWLGETVRPLLSRVVPDPDWSHPGWELLSLVLLGVGALLGLALLVYLVVLAVRAFRGRRRRAAERGGRGSAAPVGPAEWEALAARSAERGAWREAALALYQAVVLRLGEGGIVRVERAKTPGDYRREARRQGGEVVGRVEAFLGWFERVAYGRAEPGPEQYDRLLSTARALGARG